MNRTKIILLVFLLLFLFNFHSIAHVKMDTPTGGESYTYSQIVSIQWHVQIPHSTIQNWDIYFSEDGGTTWNVIIEDIYSGTLSYNWTVPNLNIATAKIKVVMDNSDYDYEDISGNFTIGTPVTSIMDTERDNKCIISPNPFNEEAILSIEKMNEKPNLLQIYNSSKVLVRIIAIRNEDVVITKGNFTPGVYHYCLLKNDRQIFSGKFLVE